MLLHYTFPTLPSIGCGTTIPPKVYSELIDSKGWFTCHSHPFIGDLSPSLADTAFLAELTWQDKSFIIEPGGMMAEYTKEGVNAIMSIPAYRDENYYENLWGGEN